MANLLATVSAIAAFALTGNPYAAAAAAAAGSKVSGSSDENALKDGISAFFVAGTPVGGAIKGATTGFTGAPGAGPQGLGGFSQAAAGAKEGFMAGIPSALGGTGKPISPTKLSLIHI